VQRFRRLSTESSPSFVGHGARLAELALRHGLPAIADQSAFGRAESLAAYGVNPSVPSRRLGDYIDKILKGAKSGDLLVEQPTKCELLINLKTAKALSLTMPQPLLLRADEVIE
jgi:putative ABC transport system substrate-binding protein